MTVTTARRSEIVRALQLLRSRVDNPSIGDALTDAVEIIEGRGIPFDEIDKLPAARRTDPDTSHEFVLTVGPVHRFLLGTYALAALVGAPEIEGGYTPDEAATHAGMEPGPGPRKRISELKRAGLLADSGKRRSSALGRPQQVLTITAHGCNEAKKLGVIS